MFCERVWKLLRGKELVECSFLKSAEGIEKEGLNFSAFLEKSEKSASGRGFCWSGGAVVILNGEFNTEDTEGAEKREEKEREKI
jgi:hypothetical protein